MKLHEALATGKRCRRPGNMWWVTKLLGTSSDGNWHNCLWEGDSGAAGAMILGPNEVNASDWYVEGDPSGIHSPFHRDVFGGIERAPSRCHPEAHAAVDTGMRWGFCKHCDADLEFTTNGWKERTCIAS